MELIMGREKKKITRILGRTKMISRRGNDRTDTLIKGGGGGSGTLDQEERGEKTNHLLAQRGTKRARTNTNRSLEGKRKGLDWRKRLLGKWGGNQIPSSRSSY